MSSDPQRPPDDCVSRRTVLRGAVTLVCAAPVFRSLTGCGPPTIVPPPVRPAVIDGWQIPESTTFTPERYARLAALFDALIPGDAQASGTPQAAGATDAHAAWYLDQLFGAFDVDPPRIFAGGPYSGRHGGQDGFSQFQALTRVEALRWRTYIEGSQGMPEREWNGPVVGMRTRYETALDELERIAHERATVSWTAASRSLRRSLLTPYDATFVQLAYEHAVEGTYGDPVYGGNFEQRGWAAIDYEGDRQPIGFTARQMSNPEEG